MNNFMTAFAVLVFAAFMSFQATAQEYVTYGNGDTVKVPARYKVILVPKWVKEDRLVQLTGIPVMTKEKASEGNGSSPQSPGCTEPGELSTGAPPCVKE